MRPPEKFRLASQGVKITLMVCLLCLLCLGSFAGSGSVWASDVLFVQGGLWLKDTPDPGTLTTEPMPASNPELVPAGGVLVPLSWQPRQNVVARYSLKGKQKTLRFRAPLAPAPLKWAQIPWKAPRWFSSPSPITTLAFSPDGARLAVGDQGGMIRVFALKTAKSLGAFRRRGRVIKHLAFSQKGDILYVGEQGPEGRLGAYALEGGTFKPLWQKDSAGELGGPGQPDSNDPYGWVQRPGVYGLRVLHGDVWVAFTHSWPDETKNRKALARMYRLEGKTGKVLWVWPPKTPAKGIITWFDLDSSGETLALPLGQPLSFASPEKIKPTPHPAKVVVLKGASGEPWFEAVIPPVRGSSNVAFWRGVALKPEGNSLAASTQDGRVFLFARKNNTWKQVFSQTLIEPLMLGGVRVQATNGTLFATENAALFATGPSYVSGSAPRGMALAHPKGNALFAFGWKGAPLWVRPMGGDLQGLSGNKKWLGLLLGSPEGKSGFQGLNLLSLKKGAAREVFRFPLEGQAVYDGLRMAPNGKTLALAESPAERGGKHYGAHRIILVR